MKIAQRLMWTLGGVTLAGLAAAVGFGGITAYWQSKQVLEHSIGQQFQAVAQGRQQAMAQYLSQHKDMVSSLANSRMAQEAIQALKNPYQSYRYEVANPGEAALKNQMQQWYEQHYQAQATAHQFQPPVGQWLDKAGLETLLLQSFYIASNEKRDLSDLVDRADGSVYGQQHKRFHSSFREIARRLQYDELYLIDAQSKAVLYSVNKTPVFATSLQQGPFAQTELANLVNNVLKRPQAGLQVSAPAPFSGHFNDLTVFLAVAVKNPLNDAVNGVLVAQLPLSSISKLISDNQHWQQIGLGDTGDAYLLSEQGVLLTERRNGAIATLDKNDIAGFVFKETHSLLRTTERPDDKVLQRVDSIDFAGQRMWLVTEQTTDELFSPLNTLQQQLFFSSIGTLLLLGLAVLLLARWQGLKVARPLEQLATQLRSAARTSDLTLQFAPQKDTELAMTTEALADLFSQLRLLLLQVVKTGEHSEQLADQNQQISLRSQAGVYQQKAALSQLDIEARQANQQMQQMQLQLQQASDDASSAFGLAEQGQRAMTELSAAVKKLAAEVSGSGESMHTLEQAAANISSVLDTISGVAEQTNLLALNAAIEAARAGEHGRGFAVVADEVRRLSASTTAATTEVRQMLEQLSMSVRSTRDGFAIEQQSAEVCLVNAADAEQQLREIHQMVGSIQRINSEAVAFSRLELERSRQISDALAQIQRSAQDTDTAMTELAQSAQAQQQATRQLLQQTSVLRLN